MRETGLVGVSPGSRSAESVDAVSTACDGEEPFSQPVHLSSCDTSQFTCALFSVSCRVRGESRSHPYSPA